MFPNIIKERKPVVLVVDDSRLIRLQLRDFLEQEGYQVIEACNGSEGITQFIEHRPDIILMDYLMPIMNGTEACQKIKYLLKDTEDVSIVMITSLGSDESVEASFEAGATDYITKPISYAVLKQRLKRMIISKFAKDSLKQTRAFSESIIDNATEGIITTNSNGEIIYVNPAIEKIFGYAQRDLVLKHINNLFPKLFVGRPEDLPISDLIDGTFETACLAKNESFIPAEFSVSQFSMDNETFYTVILRDITERKRYESKIKKQAFYDALTDLPNRVLLKERLEVEIARAKRTNTQLAVMYLDLDRFKIINDTLGHDIGDALLKDVAKRMSHAIRADDFVARLGGDEFLILIPGLTNDEHIGKIASTILSRIQDPFRIKNHEINITGSIGIAICPDDGDVQESLMTNADIAMYRAKESGKNKFQTYTRELSNKALARMEMEHDLRRAIDYNEFVIHYQPKVNTETEEIVGMEALLRWQHPRLGLVPPNDFIPLAEETGMILQLGKWVLEESCIKNKALQNAGFPPLTVSVNLSMRQFEQHDFIDIVKNILHETGLEPKYLELEITESIAMLNVENTVRVIATLQELGVHFSIDDFGTGYSSLSKLGILSVNKLKIDKSFISKIADTSQDSVIASTILALGKNLNMQIVAEGVETRDQAKFLRDKECDEMQGYYFGKPMKFDDFKKVYTESIK